MCAFATKQNRKLKTEIETETEIDTDTDSMKVSIINFRRKSLYGIVDPMSS